VEVSALDLVKELKRKCRTEYFDAPVDPRLAPDYYAPQGELELAESRAHHSKANSESIVIRKTAWGTDAICWDIMLRKARGGIYGAKPSDWVSLVEFDLHTMIYNAIIYNFEAHHVNKAALRLYESTGKILEDWETRLLMCCVCGGDELYVENSVVICDSCCKGVHLKCLRVQRPEDQGYHPLRNDSAWFCSDGCMERFQRLCARFQLPKELCDDMDGVAYTVEETMVLFRMDKEPLWPGFIARPATLVQRQEAAKNKDSVVVLSCQGHDNTCQWSLSRTWEPCLEITDASVQAAMACLPDWKRQDFRYMFVCVRALCCVVLCCVVLC
jgi:hypothetical protein